MQQKFTSRYDRSISLRQKSSKPDIAPPQKLKLALVLFVALVALAFFQDDGKQIAAEAEKGYQKTAQAKITQPPFPTIYTTSFTAAQERILRLLQREYAKQPVSYDAVVMKYTEGFKEAWCADFVSWIRNEAGVPMENNVTGYWRIPGVQSVRDYYTAADAYHAVDEYVPKLGDIAFYFGETPDGNSREHIAFVLKVEGDTVTTIGGNETDKGILQIRTNKMAEGERGLAGFGESAL